MYSVFYFFGVSSRLNGHSLRDSRAMKNANTRDTSLDGLICLK